LFWGKGRNVNYSNSSSSINNNFGGIDYQTAINSATGIKALPSATSDIVAMISYNNRLCVFTSNALYEMYGTDPTTYNFQHIEGNVGATNQRSTVVVNKRLYWISYDGVYEYNGSVPIKVSEPWGGNGINGGITQYVKGINWAAMAVMCAGSRGDYLYMCIPYSGSSTNNVCLLFDAKLRKWYVEGEAYKAFATVQNDTFGGMNSGYVWKLTNDVNGYDYDSRTDTNTQIPWNITTKPYTFGKISNKITVSAIWIVYYADNPIDVYYSPTTDDASDWVLLDTLPSISSDGSQYVPLSIQNMQLQDLFRFKFVGSGRFMINQIELRMKFSKR
jgi:hypothetical protein